MFLRKLIAFEFNKSLISLFSSYFGNRKQYIVYNGYASFSYIISTGVRQGSNQGPPLFVNFINDFNNLTCGNPLFAGDLEIFVHIASTNDSVHFKCS